MPHSKAGCQQAPPAGQAGEFSGGRLLHEGPSAGVSVSRATGPHACMHACTCAGTANEKKMTQTLVDTRQGFSGLWTSPAPGDQHVTGEVPPTLLSPASCNCNGVPDQYDSALHCHLMLRSCKGVLGCDHTTLQSSEPACSKVLSRTYLQSMGYSTGLDDTCKARAPSNQGLCQSAVHAGRSGQML